MGKKTSGKDFFAVLAYSVSIMGLAGSAEAAPPGSRPADGVATQLNEALGLRASKLAAIKPARTQANALSVAVPLGDEEATLELVVHAVRSPDYRVEIDFGGGEMGEVPAGPVKTYRGIVKGRPGSLVAAHEDADGLHAKVLLPDGNKYWVEPVAGRVAAGAGVHVVYHNDDVMPSGASCAAHDDMRLDAEEMRGAVAAAGAACGTGLCVAEIAADADVEFYLRYGTVEAVEDRINAIINGLNIEYERDVAIRHVISHIIVRIAEPDPYTATEPQTLLNQMRSYWNANHTGVPRDTAELFTGKNIDGSVIGIAWIGAICGSYGYSVVQADCCGSFACATDLSAHELGHNWNAGHCSCTGTTMNPSLTCTNTFHPTLTVPVINSFRDSRSCLSAGSGCTTNAECDDGNPCTDDLCTTGNCTYGSNSAPCDDGFFCNGSDACSGGSCTVHTGNPCPPPDGDANCSESCNEALNSCTSPDPNGTSCTDGLWCNGSDSCSGGSCSVHSGNPCPGADGDGNCRESCVESSDSCTGNDPNNSTCNDGNANTTNDVCTSGICAGTPITVNCDDGNPCTIDTVSGTTCLHSAAPSGTPCSDGLFCNGADTCSNQTCSVHAGNPCPGPDGDANCRETCSESADACTANDPNGASCNDGNPATSGDACASGTCVGTPISCDDGNPCTADTLSGSTCLHAAAAPGTPCDDGLYCNGADSCNSGACSVHAGDPCASGAECANVCNETAGHCFVAMNTPCTPDSNLCTTDVCNGSGSCVHPLRPAGWSCNDNLFCNGSDACNNIGTCVHSGSPCPGADGDVDCTETCSESADTCTANDPNGSPCGPGDTCLDGQCVTGSYCGDGWCDENESCRRCPSDCGFPQGYNCDADADCCSGRCRNGKCARAALTVDR